MEIINIASVYRGEQLNSYQPQVQPGLLLASCLTIYSLLLWIVVVRQ